MDVFRTHGAFSWSELTTSDPAAASDFYAKLFGWTVKDMGPQMGNYRVANVGEQGVAGIMAPQPSPQQDAPSMQPSWSLYVTVDNVDDTLAQAQGMGAVVCMGPMDVPTVGRMATFKDPQGAVLSIIQYEAKPA